MNQPPPPADLTVVTITTTALHNIHRHIALAPEHHETGGILLGHEHPAGVAVTTAGDPGPNAQHASTRFLRDLAHAQLLANEAYRDQRAVWVGEWHTHPAGPHQPSGQDLATYRGFLSDPELNFSVVVALIASPAPHPATDGHPHDSTYPWVVHAWVIDSHRVAATPCTSHTTCSTIDLPNTDAAANAYP